MNKELQGVSLKNRKIELATLVGKGSKVTGKLDIKGGIKVDGEVDGEIISDSIVIIGATGLVKANINAEECLISGKVIGDVVVKGDLELETAAKIEGNVKAKVLKVHSGAVLNGMCTMMEKQTK